MARLEHAHDVGRVHQHGALELNRDAHVDRLDGRRAGVVPHGLLFGPGGSGMGRMRGCYAADLRGTPVVGARGPMDAWRMTASA